MIKVTILVGSPIVVMAAETATVREILEENDVIYAGRVLTMDGYTLPRDPSALDKPLSEYVSGDKCTIAISSKNDNAADATVVGSALVVTSALKREDLETVKKYRPKALTLYEKVDDRKEPVFAIMLGKGTGSIDRNGAIYGETVDAAGKAQITVMLKDVDANVVKDDFGPALLKLAKLEATLTDAMEEIAAEKAEIEEHIHFA